MFRKIAVLGVAAAMLLSAAPAWGHVTAEDPSVPKDSDQKITLSVPVEGGTEGDADAGNGHMHAMHEEGGDKGGAGAFNVQVVVRVPDAFAVLSCEATAMWDCSVTPGSDSEKRPGASAGTPGQISFQRKSGPYEDQDHLSFTLHTPKDAGTYDLPTVQKQSDGAVHHWDGGPQRPAPSLQVG
jgi:uncharacterized protein YcnI